MAKSPKVDEVVPSTDAALDINQPETPAPVVEESKPAEPTPSAEPREVVKRSGMTIESF